MDFPRGIHPADNHVLGPYRVVGDQVRRGNGRMGHFRHDLKRDRGPGCHLKQVAQLVGHHPGIAYLPVEGGFISEKREPGRIVLAQDPLLPGHTRF